jgi:O-antigen ligase
VVHDFRRARADGRARRLADWLGGEGSRNLLLLLLVLVGLAGLLASLSRAGTALGILAVLTAALGARGTGRARLRLVAALLVLAIAAVPLAQIGVDNLVDRFSRVADDFTSEQGRGRVWLDTLAMGARYPVAGTGFGTFAVAYPLYRSPSVRLLYTDAHNDLLQLFSEAGIPGLVLGLLLVLALLRRVAQGIAGSFGTLGVGFAAGVGAFLLHSLVDFNLHIPANAMVFALLAGALSGLPWNEPTSG